MTLADAQATFCATLVDEWVRRGVSDAVVAPGSRSTPMAVALAARDELSLHVLHDERAAAFASLGLGLDGRPAVLLCTSGTAAANFHPAVVEAGLSEVPMLVVTADRPPELRDVGAPQTIDQTALFGRAVRWFHDPGVADQAASGTWRSLARRAVEASASGPVHLNLPFREPLLGTAGELPETRSPVKHSPSTRDAVPTGTSAPSIATSASSDPIRDRLVEYLSFERGLILAGGRSGVAVAQIEALAAATGWPVLADPLSGCRGLEAAVTAFDAILRHRSFGSEHVPEVVVRVGRPATSRVLANWVAEGGATLVQVGGPGVIDPDHRVAVAVPASAAPAMIGAASRPHSNEWLAGWVGASRRAEQVIEKVLGDVDGLTEPAAARLVAECRPEHGRVVVGSSMPVRDMEWFGGPTATAHANRGASGIDGVVSTALGVALRGHPTIALVGDIAFLHDGGALTALADRRCDLRIVVIDNDGGGIFSFLPQASALTEQRFEQLFGTPHGTDLVGIARAHRLDATTATSVAELRTSLATAGPTVTRIATDRRANVLMHDALNSAVADAL